MSVVREGPGLFRIRLGGVNAFLLDADSDGLVLVDAGYPGQAGKLAQAVASLGYGLDRIRHILVTHCHADHTGGLAEMKALTGGRVCVHLRDAPLVSRGKAKRRLVRTPGLLNRLRFRKVRALASEVTPVPVDLFLNDGDVIPVAGGIRVVHTPGHTEGHVAFLVRRWKLAFVGDAASNTGGILGLMPAYEQLRQGLYSLRHLGRQDFEVACFGHGPSISSGAGRRFRRLWGGR